MRRMPDLSWKKLNENASSKNYLPKLSNRTKLSLILNVTDVSTLENTESQTSVSMPVFSHFGKLFILIPEYKPGSGRYINWKPESEKAIGTNEIMSAATANYEQSI